MKRSFNFLLIISIVCFVLSVLLYALSIRFDGFSITSQLFESTTNDTIGIAILFAPFTIMGDIGIGLLLLFALLVGTSFMNFCMVISQLLARLFQIGQEKDWKLIIGKVFTIIAIIIQVLLCCWILLFLISTVKVGKIFLLLAIIINVTNIILSIKELNKLKTRNNNIIENDQRMQ